MGLDKKNKKSAGGLKYMPFLVTIPLMIFK
jgi:hypothetical protein